MTARDYTLYNMPALLDREVLTFDPKKSESLAQDASWHQTVRLQHFHFFMFLQENGLVMRPLVASIEDVDKVVLRFSELTSLGQQLVSSGADDKWFASFDRPGSKKKFDDVSYLEKQLAKLAP